MSYGAFLMNEKSRVYEAKRLWKLSTLLLGAIHSKLLSPSLRHKHSMRVQGIHHVVYSALIFTYS